MADITGLYYSSEGNIGYGAELRVGQDNGSPETFVAIAQVDTIQFGEMTAGILNKTHLRSPGRAHEKLATIRDLGPFSITGTLNMKHGSHNNAGGDGFTSGGLIAIHRSLEERNFELEIPDGSPATVLPFRGVISSLNLGELSLEGIQKFTAQVQPLADYTADLP
jgi:tail tube protein